MRASILVLGGLLGLAACGEAPVDEDAAVAEAELARSGANAQCERNALSQIACLRKAFEIEGCTNIEPIGSMYKDGAQGFAHLTAFDANETCQTEIKAAAERLGFESSDGTEFNRDFGGGYRELLTVADDGTLQWEREQQ